MKPRSPGPVYMLPSTIGYNKHDVSRYRNPQYTISPNVRPPLPKSIGPGPRYQVAGVNEHGQFRPPAYSIKSRAKPLTGFVNPGPGAHSPEKVPRMKEQRPPAYTMQLMGKFNASTIGPGPAYTLPSMIGPKVPNKQAAGAYTMAGRLDTTERMKSPGPATYRGINTNIYKNKLPAFTMSGRQDKGGPRILSPGPAAYLPKKLCGEKGPMFSMGSCLGDIHVPFITAEDNMSCVGK